MRDLRKQAGLTQEQLGFEAELERNYISMLERGERQPTLTTLVKLARPLQSKASHIGRARRNIGRRHRRARTASGATT
ncbi:helix-turn-helix transcriptional regulator [Roseateles sp. 22389]|uniref:helix-turn-helix transcriptional regulator n=1 Tax=Roseateles sp. 22389 TaxID=3453916 RepID=UPI003F83C888